MSHLLHPADVSAKRPAKRRRVRKPTVKFLATDMDSTLSSFWYYFCPWANQIGHLLADTLNVTPMEVEREFGRVFHEFGTHEWPWAPEMTAFRRSWRGTAREFRQKVSEPFWKLYDSLRVQYLQPFDDVMNTLQVVATKDKDRASAIVSDAPFHMALTRACDLGVDGLIDGLYAIEAPLPDPSAFVDPFDMELGLERIAMFEARAHRFKIVKKLPKAFEKPNTGGLMLAMSDFGVTADETLFVGDSLKKDGGVAEAAKVRFMWARYGLSLPPEYIDLIDRRFTPNGEAPTNGHGVTYRPAVHPPMIAEAASFREVLKHL